MNPSITRVRELAIALLEEGEPILEIANALLCGGALLLEQLYNAGLPERVIHATMAYLQGLALGERPRTVADEGAN